MASSTAKGLLDLILPKRRPKDSGVSHTNTFRPKQTDSPLAAPAARDHLTDLFVTRHASDARTLLKALFQHDPDVSAAVNAFLTVADTEPYWKILDLSGEISRDGHKLVEQILTALFTRSDYTQPANFQIKQSLRAVCADLRYMALLRGAIGAELVLNKQFLPQELRNVDMATVKFKEKKPGVYIPEQTPTGSSDVISLDIPTFFVAFFRRDPTEIYSNSFFVASINTIAARQQVINDLYRIMRINGFPRIHITLLEEVLRKNAPADAKSSEALMSTWLEARRSEVVGLMSTLRADQTLVHFDSMEPKMLNEKNPGATLDITAVIETLNAQNQAALKVVSTVIGRGDKAGVNTASTEARIFALNAEQLNLPIADLLSQILTLAVRLHGVEATVQFGFETVELRPILELEPQLTMKQTRYLQLLSFGLISDDDFHFELFNRVRPDLAPELSGTLFMDPPKSVDVSEVSPNDDPMGRSLAPEGSEQVRSN